VYSIADYCRMVADPIRMTAYRNALEQAISPGDVVLDLGSGTGIFALMACQCGAGSVIAIEPDASIHVARKIAADNGLADRIRFIPRHSRHVSLSERVDVMVSDMRGILPLFGTHLPDVADARERFLAPDGRQIPERDRLWAALVEAPDIYRQYISPCDNRPQDIDMSAAQPYVVNTWRRVRLDENALLMPPLLLADIDYQTVTTADVSSTVSGTIPTKGTAHGVLVWFEAVLFQDVRMTNAPGAPDTLYGQKFFPLEHPVSVAEKDLVFIDVSARLIGEDYIWRWRTRIRSDNPAKEEKADFRQSTFFARPHPSEALRYRASSHKPTLGIEGRIDRTVLELMDGATSLETIAGQLAETYPEHFQNRRQALDRAARISAKYSSRNRP